MMKKLGLLCLILFQALIPINCTKIDVQELKCLVCQQSIKELSKAIESIDPSKKADVGGHRLDAEGNYKTKTVPLSKSEVYLSELTDEICEKMDDYVRATFKDTGKLTLLNLIVDGKMNPDMDKVDIIQDDDLNKSLKYYCESLMEEYEDQIINQFVKETPKTPLEICTNTIDHCDKIREEL